MREKERRKGKNLLYIIRCEQELRKSDEMQASDPRFSKEQMCLAKAILEEKKVRETVEKIERLKSL